jgi:methionine synthase II (cobalamin-independent)
MSLITIRTNVVGSLLRPAALKQVRKDFDEGKVSAVELLAIEDDAVRTAVTLQERAGLDIVTDGATALCSKRQNRRTRPRQHEGCQLQSLDHPKRRIDEATKYIPLEQLAISRNVGFASDIVGNLIAEDDQKRKLKRVVETARQVWN